MFEDDQAVAWGKGPPHSTQPPLPLQFYVMSLYMTTFRVNQRGIVVAHAELVEAGAAVKGASGELPGVVLAALLLLGEHLAVGIVVVTVDFIAAAIGHTDDGAQAVEEVVVLLAVGGALVVQHATATAHEEEISLRG